MTDYHRMSIGEKQTLQRERAREPSVSCPDCDTHVMAVDLLDHMAHRCDGPREPHPGSVWVTWPQALKLGVPRETLRRWVEIGRVRARGEIQSRRYLLRDVALLVAARRQNKRRQRR